ncbi:hypothetical protein N8Z78_02325, partial [Octadecabacter sp.]|nr:hypothetical protein [Octadecabacter sp.]
MKNETSITRSWRKPSLLSAALELFPLRETLRFLITGLLATLTHAAVGYTLISTTEMLGPMANICGFLSAWWVEAVYRKRELKGAGYSIPTRRHRIICYDLNQYGKRVR